MLIFKCFNFNILFIFTRPVCYHFLNNGFQCLNNITLIFIHFFTHIYFQKIQTTLLEQHYQIGQRILFLKKHIVSFFLVALWVFHHLYRKSKDSPLSLIFLWSFNFKFYSLGIVQNKFYIFIGIKSNLRITLL